MPRSNVPGEIAAAEEPFPVKPTPFARQKITEADLTNRTPEAHAWALERFRGFHYERQFTPNSIAADTLMFPGFDGGGEWGGSTFDPETHILYINGNDFGLKKSLVKHSADSPGRSVYLSQCSECHRAYDAATGKLLWEPLLPFSANATPITYEIHGWQYVVIAAGGQRDPNTPGGGGVYVAFALP